MRKMINLISWGTFLILINHMSEDRKIKSQAEFKSSSSVTKFALKKQARMHIKRSDS